jgi:hypothetical protein
MTYRDPSLEGRVLESERALEERLDKLPVPAFRLFGYKHASVLARLHDSVVAARGSWRGSREAAQRYLDALGALVGAIDHATPEADRVRDEAITARTLERFHVYSGRRRDRVRIALSYLGIGNLAATRRALAGLIHDALAEVDPAARANDTHARRIVARFAAGDAELEITARPGSGKLYFSVDRADIAVRAGVMRALGCVHAWVEQGTVRAKPGGIDGLEEDVVHVLPAISPALAAVPSLRSLYIAGGIATVSWLGAGGSEPIAPALAVLFALRRLTPPRWALAIGRGKHANF